MVFVESESNNIICPWQSGLRHMKAFATINLLVFKLPQNSFLFWLQQATMATLMEFMAENEGTSNYIK